MELVITPAGVSRKPGMTRDDVFAINAGIVRALREGIAKRCPNAIVNLDQQSCKFYSFNCGRGFQKKLELMRANTFVASNPKIGLTNDFLRIQSDGKATGGAIVLSITFIYKFSAFSSTISSQTEVLGLHPKEFVVPVVGGHAGVTILPLLSQVSPPSPLKKLNS